MTPPLAETRDLPRKLMNNERAVWELHELDTVNGLKRGPLVFSGPNLPHSRETGSRGRPGP